MNQKKKEWKDLTTAEKVGGSVALGIIVLIFLILYNSISSVPAKPKSCSDYYTNARIMAGHFVESHLMYPASSEIPDTLRADFKFSCTDKHFKFGGWVDAANGFGAKRRVNYVQEVEFLGGDWADIQNWRELSFNFIGE